MLPTILAIVFGTLSAVAAGLCVWLLADRKSWRAQREQAEANLRDARAELESAEQQAASFQETIHARDIDLTALRGEIDAQKKRLQDRVEQFEAAQKQARETFDALAGKTLREANQQFLQLAKKTFESDQKDAKQQLEQRKQAIESLVKPLREALAKQEQAFVEMDKRHREAHGGLGERLLQLFDAQDKLRNETAKLGKALRRPEVRGRWGEVQLRRVAELAGMIPHCDFTEQQNVETDEGRLQPDMVVNLPAGRTIVIDAKTPINAYIEALECESESDRMRCLERHAQQVDDKIKQLSAKAYQRQFDRSPDFVVLFIPGEAFLQAAVQLRPDLIERAMNLNVVIASPTTLIALLKAVEMGWREERLAESAEQVRDLGVQLHERLAILVDKADRLGKHLDNAIGSYNDFVGSLESRFLVTARQFRALGADSKKELPAEGEVRIVQDTVRPVAHLAPADGVDED